MKYYEIFLKEVTYYGRRNDYQEGPKPEGYNIRLKY